jgi:hypothetical protein
MHEQNLIDGRLFEWSDLMRAAGNEAAHGVGLSIQQPDAKDILEFTNAIMDYLVEADIGRYKRVIGDALRSRTGGRQTDRGWSLLSPR